MKLIILKSIRPEYEAEAWETGSRHSEDTGYDTKSRSHAPRSHPTPRSQSPHSYHQASQSGDYYRDTNLTMNSSSNPNHRQARNLHAPSVHSNTSRHTTAQMPPMSQFGGLPHLPFMPFGGGPGSAAGSDYGGHVPLPMPSMGYQTTGSAFGMMSGDPRNTMMTNMYGGGSGSQIAGAPPPLGAAQRPTSTFSMATTANLFTGPSMNPNPTDDDLVNALRNYLSTQDLMTVTKK